MESISFLPAAWPSAPALPPPSACSPASRPSGALASDALVEPTGLLVFSANS